MPGYSTRDRLAVLAALSAAAWFDFFLTQPHERFTITRHTDIETTVLLLVIGVAVTEISVWGRRQHAAASRRAGYLDGINSAARAVAAGGSPSALIEQVTGQLTRLLSRSAPRSPPVIRSTRGNAARAGSAAVLRGGGGEPGRELAAGLAAGAAGRAGRVLRGVAGADRGAGR